jgi:hypothetical protein
MRFLSRLVVVLPGLLPLLELPLLVAAILVSGLFGTLDLSVACGRSILRRLETKSVEFGVDLIGVLRVTVGARRVRRFPEHSRAIDGLTKKPSHSCAN